MPEVSVIIPTYNSARFLPAAVESVLGQTFRDLEILVVDDGSTDDTEEVMQRYGPPVRYLKKANGGVSSARNVGIAASIGRYVAFLDADDTWFPQKLAVQLQHLEAERNYRVCYSAFSVVDSVLQPLGTRRCKPIGSTLEDLLLRGNIVGSICTVLCERSLLAIDGSFDPTLSQCADWDMWVRLATLTEFLYVDEPLVTYRQHETNMSRNAPLLESDSVRVLEKGFASSNVPEFIRARRRQGLGRNYMVLAGTYFQAGHYRDFCRCAVRALAMDIGQIGYLLRYPARVATRKWTGIGS